MNKVKFVANANRWFDKVNGNTYHSVKITNTETGETIKSADMVYGYDEHYRQTALDLMLKAGWLPTEYNDKVYMYERENEYPIQWNVFDGTKKQMKENVK